LKFLPALRPYLPAAHLLKSTPPLLRHFPRDLLNQICEVAVAGWLLLVAPLEGFEEESIAFNFIWPMMILAAPEGVDSDEGPPGSTRRGPRGGEMRVLVRQRLGALKAGQWQWCLREALLRAPPAAKRVLDKSEELAETAEAMVRLARQGALGRALARGCSYGRPLLTPLLWEYISNLVSPEGGGRNVPDLDTLNNMWSDRDSYPRVEIPRKVLIDVVREMYGGTAGGLSGTRPDLFHLALRKDFLLDALHLLVTAGANGEWHPLLVSLLQLLPVTPLRKGPPSEGAAPIIQPIRGHSLSRADAGLAAALAEGGIRPVVTPEHLRKLPAACLIRVYGRTISDSVGPMVWGTPGWGQEGMIRLTQAHSDLFFISCPPSLASWEEQQASRCQAVPSTSDKESPLFWSLPSESIVKLEADA